MTTHRVLNVHERNEAIRAAIDSIGRSQWRLEIFKEVYTGKRAAKTVMEIAKAIKLSEKAVLTQGKKLVSDGVIEQKKVDTPSGKRTAYFKIPVYTAHKAKVWAGLKNPKKFDTKHPTKQRPQIKGVVAVERVTVAKNNVPKQVTIDDIASFDKVRSVGTAPAKDFKKLPELNIKQGFRKILGQADSKKDWGGETNDLFSGKLKYKGKRIGAAFAFKGKGTQGQLTPAKMGKNGDQISRLFASPAQMFFVVYPREIAESVLDQMRAFAFARAKSGEKIYYCVIGDDDFARLYHAYPKAFAASKKGT